ncbi:MAG: phosphodiester glycosidase family protein [Gaiellaceae bacterium]
MGPLCAGLAAILIFPAAGGARSVLAPGVTHERKLIFNGGRPVVLHVVRTPRPSDLYRLRPVRARGPDRRQTVPAMQARVSPQATAVGVNGDYFSFETGHTSGLFLSKGVLSARPSRARSALALGQDGRLLLDVLPFRGEWRGTGSRHPIRELNRPVVSPRVGLFTRFWGEATPRARNAVEVVLSGISKTRLDAVLTGTVAAVERGGRTAIPAGGAVLQARGAYRRLLLAEAPVGSVVRVRLRIPDLPAGTLDGIGGGPGLVRNGRVVRQADQGFSPAGYAVRHPRTAVGQLANGRLLFVVADGRSGSSYGLTTRALAEVMIDLGATTAMALDGGGSSTIAFDARVLNAPSDGAPRRVATGLFLHYYGIYAPSPGGTILSPNGDGVGDRKTLVAKVVRRSRIRLRLLRPNGSVAWRRTRVVEPGWITRAVSNAGMPEGRWRWVVEATDTAAGHETRMARTFRVNKTLGYLRLSRETMRVRPRRGGRLRISVNVTRRARLGVVVLGADGRSRRALFRGQVEPARQAWRWNGRRRSGAVVRAGTFAIRVTARNGLGAVSLRRSVRVIRSTRR